MKEFGFSIFQPMALINYEKVPGREGGREGGEAEGGVVLKEDFVRGKDDEGRGRGRMGGGGGGSGIIDLSNSSSSSSSSSSFPTTSPTKALLHDPVEGCFPHALLPSMRVHSDRRRVSPQLVFPTTQHRQREDDKVRPTDALLEVEVEEEGNDLNRLAQPLRWEEGREGRKEGRNSVGEQSSIRHALPPSLPPSLLHFNDPPTISSAKIPLS